MDVELIDEKDLKHHSQDSKIPTFISMYISGISCDQIAIELSVSPRTIRNWISTWSKISTLHGFKGQMLRNYLKLRFCSERSRRRMEALVAQKKYFPKERSKTQKANHR